MKNISKSLSDYVKGKVPKISDNILCEYASKDADALINSIFKIINEELDNMTGVGTLDRVRNLFKSISVICENNSDVNRKIVTRRLHKLDEKIDCLKRENYRKFVDINNAFKELEKVRREIENVQDRTNENDTMQFVFVNYLIDRVRNIPYIEYVFDNLPVLVNLKDRNETSLFRNLIDKLIESVFDDDEKDIEYYNNLINLVQNQNNFNLSEKEKRIVLEELYTAKDKLGIVKKNRKKNINKIKLLDVIIDGIKNHEERNLEISGIAKKYNISIFFDDDILEQAKLVHLPIGGNNSLRDLVCDYVITIDGANAVEIDDALSCKKLSNGNYLLGVHIASILGYFSYDSLIVKEAIQRSRSIYLPQKYQNRENEYSRTVPLFPYDFSAKTGSLLPNEKKLTRSYFFEIDSCGNVVKEKFLKTIVCTNKRTTYSEIDNILENGCSDKLLQETVFNLQKVTELLEKRHKIDNFYEKISGIDYYGDDNESKNIGALKIVAQTMLLTGSRVAEFFADPSRNYPCLYRVHEVNEDNVKKIQEMVEHLDSTYASDEYKRLLQLVQGIYPSGWYDVTGSHYGLGLNHYCHCTSGLRRAADIVVEHALEVCYDTTPTDKALMDLENEVRQKADFINSREIPIDWFVEDCRKSYHKR